MVSIFTEQQGRQGRDPVSYQNVTMGKQVQTYNQEGDGRGRGKQCERGSNGQEIDNGTRKARKLRVTERLEPLRIGLQKAEVQLLDRRWKEAKSGFPQLAGGGEVKASMRGVGGMAGGCEGDSSFLGSEEGEPSTMGSYKSYVREDTWG